MRIAPKDFAKAQWSVKQWNVFDGLKVNGAGAGYFEYQIAWPAGLKVADIETATFREGQGRRRETGWRLHAWQGHARSEPESERLSHDG